MKWRAYTPIRLSRSGYGSSSKANPARTMSSTFYLAPPLVARRDADGHLLKRRYGAWMLNGFRLLAKLKGLRGTFLDPFGKTAERQMERQLARDYLELVNRFRASMDARRLPIAIELANCPSRSAASVTSRNGMWLLRRRSGPSCCAVTKARRQRKWRRERHSLMTYRLRL